MAAIADGANGTPITPVDAAAVKSNEFHDAYIVAMSFTIPGEVDPSVGVWALGSLETPYGPILAGRAASRTSSPTGPTRSTATSSTSPRTASPKRKPASTSG